MIRTISLLSLFGIGSLHAADNTVVVADYGVDCSFPVHSKELRCGNRLGDRKKVYEEFMQGCRDFYGKRASMCDAIENDRIEMSIRQPQSMVNYTSTGFKKIRAPQRTMDLLLSHWNRNKDNMKKENWGAGNVYVNHWESPTYMVSVEDTGLRGGGSRLKDQIWDSVQPIIEEWTGMEQNPTSQYGIRVYTRGAILNPHVDRLPLVSSCIINVAQDLEEPWILEVIDRDGHAVNVTMEAGDMVLYESGSLIHARPFAMKGEYFANIFIHFEPTGRPLYDFTNKYLETLDDILPPYVLPGSPAASAWTKANPYGRKNSPAAPVQHAPAGHHAAATGDVSRLKQLSKSNKDSLVHRDENGWEPIHEAVRGGHKEVVEFLVKNGADINSRTGVDKAGVTPLNIALHYLEYGDELTSWLISQGAVNEEEEL